MKIIRIQEQRQRNESLRVAARAGAGVLRGEVHPQHRPVIASEELLRK